MNKENVKTVASGSSGGRKRKKSKKKGRKLNEVANISEDTRNRISQILNEFQNSNNDVYTFENNLTNQERAAVHILSSIMGMTSKSSGRGQQRCVSVYKTRNDSVRAKGKENLASFRFSKASKDVLQDLFSRYPPDEAEMCQNKFEESIGQSDGLQAPRENFFCRPAMTNSEISNKVASLASRIEKSPHLRQITEERSKLPIASFRDVITSSIESHQVVLVCGETGCGKTTQVPQFLLDHAWSKGETCKIVCTQPRRISATSVAERIASERGEDIGESVGYKIRLESRGGRNSSLVFCTNGVLLRVLVGKRHSSTKKKCSERKNGNSISEITHIIVDEIHERDRFSDFMLAIIRDMLPSYPHLHLILMSATIDAERFSKYFGGCPIIQVPGFTYPVKAFYLEDVVLMLKSSEAKCSEPTEDFTLTDESIISLDEAIELALLNDEFDPLLELISSEGNPKIFNYRHSKTGLTPLMVFACKGRVGDISMLLTFGVDCNIRSNAGETALDFAQQEHQEEAVKIIKNHMEEAQPYSEEEQKLLDKYLSNVDPELIDCVLIEKLLMRICTDSQDGAILIFLPGWDVINRTRDRLLASPYFKDPSKFVIIALHSRVPSVEQKKVFQRPPPGCRKIILSTNIAETSVTIDDVVYVIDSGRMKEKSYDPYHNVSTLHTSWVSKASAKQREGRAGRCQPGICYHLYSKLRAAEFPDFQVPEIKRMPIEELCLQLKLIDPSCKIEDFLQKTLDPPVFETIHNAIIVLQDIGALTPDEKLTELGKKLGSLPVHPLTCKMLFLGILVNCLDPALTLACAADYRDPFIIPVLFDEKKKADAAKSRLASLYGGKGDQLAVIAAFESWQTAKQKSEVAKFCSEYFVSANTMRMISRMRKQLECELRRNGFIPGNTRKYNMNSHDPGILHALLVAGLYPMVGRMVSTYGKGSRVETVDGNKVRLHPSSTNAKLLSKKSASQILIVFDEITRGDGGMYLKICSIMGSLPLLLFAAEILVVPANEDDEVDESNAKDEADYSDVDKQVGEKIMSSPGNSVKVIVDRWLPFESTALDVAQINCLRERLSASILFKVKHPEKALPEHLVASLGAIARVLSHDGMSGISLPFGSEDSVPAEVNDVNILTNQTEQAVGHQLPNTCIESKMQHQLPTTCPESHMHHQLPNTCPESQTQHQLPNTCPESQMQHSDWHHNSSDCRREAINRRVNTSLERIKKSSSTVGMNHDQKPTVLSAGENASGSPMNGTTVPKGNHNSKRKRGK